MQCTIARRVRACYLWRWLGPVLVALKEVGYLRPEIGDAKKGPILKVTQYAMEQQSSTDFTPQRVLKLTHQGAASDRDEV